MVDLQKEETEVRYKYDGMESPYGGEAAMVAVSLQMVWRIEEYAEFAESEVKWMSKTAWVVKNL